MAYVSPFVTLVPLPPVIILGAGGHGKVMVNTLRMLGREILFVTDDSPELCGTSISGVQVRGTDSLIHDYLPDAVELVNGVGSVHRPTTRKDVFNRFNSGGYRFATVIHPAAEVAPSVEIAQGAQIMSGAVVQPGVLIGANTIVNTRCSIDHDCVIGAHTHIAPGVTLSGNVKVGQVCHIGTGATVIQGLSIGHQAMVAAGAVVIRDVLKGSRVCGVPATEMPPSRVAHPAPATGH